jgi:uncharacterized protein YndB with AHSA1/START domain
MKTIITVETTIHAPLEKVWHFWTTPFHILHWNTASNDWQTTTATNDLQVGGKFNWRMESKDGSVGFDFGGTYQEILTHSKIHGVLDDDRLVIINFKSEGKSTILTEQFEAESENDVELQKAGWQAILNNFKKYVEKAIKNETLHFEITINAKAEKVYQMMLEKVSYSEWTSIFNPTSRYEGDWGKGSTIKFLGCDQDGNEGGGMLSRIKENIPNSFVSIEHFGIIKNGKEITAGPDVELWAGGLENYTFETKKEHTVLSVDLDSNEEFNNYFQDIYPKALDMLKSIVEK